nr:MAG TPA: hypothetical protein [Caudoviricetes sp.]
MIIQFLYSSSDICLRSPVYGTFCKTCVYIITF